MSAVGYKVPSCYPFFRRRSLESSCCASLFSKKITRGTRFLNFAISILNIWDTPAYKEISAANGACSDLKVMFNFTKIPNEASSLFRKVKKAGKSYCYLSTHGGCREWIWAGVRTTGLIKKWLTIMGDGLFKPAQFMGMGRTMRKIWQILSILKSGAKILNGSGKLYLESRKKMLKRIKNAALEVWEFTLSVSRYCGHTCSVAYIILALCKSIFGLLEIWMKTI